MFRKLLLPAVAATLVAGCVTTDYGYRGGRGDYYYGQPSTEYRYHGGYGGYYPYGGYPYGYYGRYPYGAYGYPYYGYPYGGYRYPYYYYPSRPGHSHPPSQGGADRDRPAPWRNYDEIIRRRQGQSATPSGDAIRPQMAVPRPMPAAPRTSGSRMEQAIRQAQQRQGERRRTDEP
jgi:hypothetical protein